MGRVEDKEWVDLEKEGVVRERGGTESGKRSQMKEKEERIKGEAKKERKEERKQINETKR